MPSPFRFCLRCPRVSTSRCAAGDFAKLGTYATEGRSSAVSLVSASLVRALRQEHDLDDKARKLLTFVDNRQDASLQAGHFNDFTQITQLRGALYRAVSAAGDTGLRHDTVGGLGTGSTGLTVTDYAQNPGVKFSQREQAQAAMRRVLAYRIYTDLERGWRVTMPNLEQTGLLRFGYVERAGISWPTILAGTRQVPVLQTDTPDHRAQLIQVVLDEMRRSLAVEADVLTGDGFERTQQLSDLQLTGVWAIPPERTAGARPHCVRHAQHPRRSAGIRALHRPRRALAATCASLASFRKGAAGSRSTRRSGSSRTCFCVLTKFGLLWPRISGATGVKASSLVWLAGGGLTGAPDPLRETVDPEAGTHVNDFFRDLYARLASEFAGLVAREHTAQVRAEDRQFRETEFREGRLPLLYCSPTMELGVDIADLNAVGMRNVPPTPANYAQRSGRAGRGGQPALVTTYCSTGSAHDEYYFRRSERMVAGAVAPPRLDLANEDLIRSHVHAIWLAETGAGLGSRLPDVVDVAREDLSMPLYRETRRPAG